MSAQGRWLVAAVAIGLPYAVALLGWSRIDPTNIAWLREDPATHYIGWALYRYEPQWHFPLTWSTRVGYPVGLSISYFDLVPLAAVVLRPLSGLLPESFQYMGLWACLCFILQAYFALRLSGLIFRGQPLPVLAATLLLVTAPAFTWRFLGHHSLASHWLIVASLWAYFRDSDGSPTWRWVVPFAAILAVAGGVNPYIAMLCLLIALAGVGRLLLEGRCRWLNAAVYSSALCGCLATSLLVFGVFILGDSSGYEGGGYGVFSMNLLAPVDPMKWGSILLPSLPTATWGQYEGYNYLGLGVIALWIITILGRPSLVLGFVTRRTLPLLVVAVLCTLAALSSTVTVGSLTVARVPLPRLLGFLARCFRASGRLFWPAHYLLILGSVVVYWRRWTSPWRGVLLVAAVVLQVADLAPLRAHVHESLAGAADSPLRSPRWRALGGEHRRLTVLPAWQCGPESSPGGNPGFATFGLLAAQLRMETNSYYVARVTREQTRVHCFEVPAATLNGAGLDPDAAYVVDDKLLIAWGLSGITTHRCEVVDGFNLCTRDRAGGGPGPAWREKIAGLVSDYPLGSPLAFRPSGNGLPYLWLGWSSPEPWGTWSNWREASVLLRPEITEPSDLELVARVHAFVNDRQPRLSVTVKANGQDVARWDLDDRPTEQRARIPAALVAGPYLYLRFVIPDAPSTVSIGLSEDDRLLGIGLTTLRVARADGDG